MRDEELFTDYEVVEDVDEYTVRTVVPYTEEAEFREYTVPSEDLGWFLMELDDDTIAERLVWVREAPDAE